MAALLMSAALALGTTVSADALADDKGRGYGKYDHPRHQVQRNKHRYDDHRPRREHARHHEHRHSKHWKHSYKPYRHDYRPYRYEYRPYGYRYYPSYRDSWYGVHLFFGG
jgi:hypothetical protein